MIERRRTGRTWAEPFPACEVRALMRRWEGLRGRLEEFPWPGPVPPHEHVIVGPREG